MSKRILVTGGAGFIGAALVSRLVLEGNEVRVLDNGWRTARRLEKFRSQLTLIEADIRDVAAVTHAAESVDTVVHLASVNGTNYFYSNPELVLDVGIRGILSVIDACRRNGVRDLVVASSSEAYQNAPNWPADETVPLVVPDVLNPRYSYGGQKIATELIAFNYGRAQFDRVTVFRPHNVYGPDMGWEHVVPQFIVRAAKAVAKHPEGDVPFRILGDGSQTRAFIHIDDFTDGLVTVIDKGSHMTVYHIGSEEEISIRSVAETILERFGRRPTFEIQPSPAGETSRRVPDITRLRSLGFAPKLLFSQGISPVIEWYRDNMHLLSE